MHRLKSVAFDLLSHAYQAASNPNVVIPVQCTLEEHYRENCSKQHLSSTKHLHTASFRGCNEVCPN